MKQLDLSQLRAYCLASFEDYAKLPGASLRETKAGRHIFIDRGSSILAVAHLDTVQSHRHFDYRKSRKHERVYNCQLDDRLGAYLIANYLPQIGISADILFTENEENCNSTAQDFTTGKQYNWCFMFDRAGDDVVMYQYEDDTTYALVESSGARVGIGSYSCIIELESLGVKCFNWGCGYHDNHSIKSYMNVRECMMMIESFNRFYRANKDTRLEHIPYRDDYYGARKEFDQWTESAWRGWQICQECGEMIPPKYFFDDLQLCRECAYWSDWNRKDETK